MTAIADLPDIRPSLLLDFANSGRVDPRIECTRASSATCWGPDGKLRTVPANTPRIDYDPVTGKCLGLLVEESRSNLLSYTKDFPQSVWGKINLAPTVADAVIAPDGTLTADGIVPNTSDLTHYIDRNIPGLGVASNYCGSIYVKKGAARDGLLRLFGTGNAMHGVKLNFDTGVATFINSNEYLSQGGVTTSWGAENVGNGWWRLWVAGYPDAATDRRLFRVTISNSAGIENYAGDGVTPGKYIWGAQLEAGSFPTSYIPTEASAVTRASDVVTQQVPSYTDLSVLAEFTHSHKLANTRALGLYAASATSSGIQVIAANSAGTASAGVIASPAGPNTTIAGLVAVSGRTDRVAFSRSQDGALRTSARGGGLISGTYTGITAPMDTLALGNSTATGSLNLCGHIRRVTTYPTALSQNQLNKLTAV